MKIIGTLIAAAMIMTACAGPGTIDDSSKLRQSELEARGFTNIQMETAYNDSWEGNYAKANVSVGSCRLALEWSSAKGWQLTGNSAAQPVAGEINAYNVSQTPAFADCAKQPTPSAPVSTP